MNIKWFKYLDKNEDKEEFERKALLNRDVFDILRKILESDLETSERDQRRKDNYKLPAWSEFQADHNGYQRALKSVIDLLPKD